MLLRMTAALMLIAMTQTASAQAPTRNVTFVLSKFETLRADVDLMVTKLGQDADGAKQLSEFLDILAFGVSGNDPVRVDTVMDGTDIRLVTMIPVDQSKARGQGFKDFLDSLDAFGITPKRKAKDRWQLKGAFAGYMRYRHGYGSIAEDVEDVPTTLADPREGIDELSKHAFAMRIANDPADQDGLEARTKAFARVQEEVLAAVKMKDNESKEDFDLRKTLTKHQLAEAGRYFAESQKLMIGWDVNAERKQADLSLDFAAIDGTSLAKGIELLGHRQSYFARIPRAEKSILSLRANHPLDELRQAQLLEALSLFKVAAKARINRSSKIEDKAGSQKVSELVCDMISDGAKSGVVDAFVEVNATDNGKHSLLGGIKSSDGNVTLDVLKAISDINAKVKVKMDVDTAGDVKIHKVFISEDDKSGFVSFYGDNAVLIGTSKDAVWFAAGEDSVKRLKDTVALNAGSGDVHFEKDIVLDLLVKVRPWLERRANSDSTVEGDAKIVRDKALAGIGKDTDIITMKLRRVENRVVGSTRFDTGILTFVGKVAGHFANEYLAK